MESFKHNYRALTNNLNSTLVGAPDADDTDLTWVMVDSPHIETNANGKICWCAVFWFYVRPLLIN